MKQPVDLGRTNPNCTARYHGTESAYTYGCRCPHAREARRLNGKRRRQHRHTPTLIDATGTARRLQALATLGWSYNQLATRLNWPWRYVQRLAYKRRPTVARATAQRVAAVYLDLYTKSGPSLLTSRYAAAKGWGGPLAWNNIDDPAEQPATGEPATPDDRPDEVLVARAMRGLVPYRQLTDADRVAAYWRLRAVGLHAGGIQARLRINSPTYRRLVALAEDNRAVEVAA